MSDEPPSDSDVDYMTAPEMPDEWDRGFVDGWNACVAIVKGETQ
jgi:hypothetical protein